MRQKVVQKTMAYITRGSSLLVFRHVDHPDAGIQVPGGSLEPGESPLSGALREALEETGLTALEPVAYLCRRRLRFHHGPNGRAEWHYVYLLCNEQTSGRWIAREHAPSDGSPGPISFEHYWVPLTSIPRLCPGMGDLLAAIGGREIDAIRTSRQPVEHILCLG